MGAEKDTTRLGSAAQAGRNHGFGGGTVQPAGQRTQKQAYCGGFLASFAMTILHLATTARRKTA